MNPSCEGLPDILIPGDNVYWQASKKARVGSQMTPSGGVQEGGAK